MYKLYKDEGDTVMIGDDDLYFTIDKEAQRLLKIDRVISDLRAAPNVLDTITIPHRFDVKLADGNYDAYIIKYIGSGIWDFPNCRCNKLVISDGIEEIAEKAFAFALASIVYWAKTCPVIPTACFEASHISELHGVEKVIKIKSNAFRNCAYLFKMTSLDNLAEIENDAFKGCASLEELSLPDTVAKIGFSAFASSGLRRMKWPSNCTGIPKLAFKSCYKLESITNLQNVQRVGEAAFASCKRLENISWPEKCSKVPPRCFSNCRFLAVLDLPDTVSEIGERAFEKSAISNFRWPSCCKFIPPYCFSDSKLCEITNIENVGIIYEYALASSYIIRSLDLTRVCTLAPNSLRFQNRNNITMPYYCTEEMAKAALGE